jgi:catechol 2,3-dioxygenase-like lactoylglutathione lyase family enzyme
MTAQLQMTKHGEPNAAGAIGAHHTAFPCWDPAGTLRLYRDILGYPLLYTIPAKGWGKDDNPDMVHFFFDIGNGDTLAFFYYFGWKKQMELHQVLRQANHLAVEVADEAALVRIRERLEAEGYDVLTVRHETIESIYINDPNGHFFEITAPTREFMPVELGDAAMTMDALIAALDDGATTVDDVWRQKARDNNPVGGAAIHVIDVPEWAGAVKYAEDAGIAIERRDGYNVIHSDEPFAIERKPAGLYPAVWYSLPAGGLEGRITRFDRDVLRIEP